MTASASGTYFDIRFQSSAKSGTVRFAAPQVEKGETANQFNILMNGDFLETVNNTDNSSATRLFPGRWTYKGTNITTSTYNCVVKDRTKNLLPEGVSGNALQLFCYPIYAKHQLHIKPTIIACKTPNFRCFTGESSIMRFKTGRCRSFMAF